MQDIANQLPNAFTDSKGVTKSHIPDVNAPAQIEVPIGQSVKIVANESKARQKRGRPIGSKNKNPQKRKEVNKQVEIIEQKNIHEHIDIANHKTPEDVQIPENNKNDEISISYVSTKKIWNRSEIVVDNIFSYNISFDIINENEDFEPNSIEECRRINDWPKWKEAIHAELNSLAKREIFGLVVQTPEEVKPVGYKWVFV